jgi:hypothetical protein
MNEVYIVDAADRLPELDITCIFQLFLGQCIPSLYLREDPRFATGAEQPGARATARYRRRRIDALMGGNEFGCFKQRVITQSFTPSSSRLR